MLTEFKVGHFTDLQKGTGCTVILPPQENVAAAAVRGAAPGTREIALLAPDKKIHRIHALVLTGGSAFGLGCAQGVMESLAEQGIGYFTHYGLVPIVPAAVIYDKNLGDSAAFPTAEDGRTALQAATFNNTAQGNVGAGTGASVGKWLGMEHAMKSGIGIAALEHKGVKVTALTVVNAAADILNKDGSLLAGAVDEQGNFLADTERPWLRWEQAQIGMAENTILTAVMTNAKIRKEQAFYLAERAHFGIARRVEPSHTGYDGDTVFVVSSLRVESNLDFLAAMVVSAVEQSIINGVVSAEEAFGLKTVQSVQSLRRSEK